MSKLNSNSKHKKSQEEISRMDGVPVLNDPYIDTNGKSVERPWRKHKKNSLLLSESLERISRNGDLTVDKKIERVRECASVLVFEQAELGDGVFGEKRLRGAWFCKDRLCVMCMWRKSMRIYSDVVKVMDIVAVEHPDLVPLFLTLTIKSPTGAELKDTIHKMLRGWGLLLKRRSVARAVKGTFRTLEITFKGAKDQYNPHIHAILLVDKTYFKKPNYIKAEKWSKLWGECLGLDYDPVVHIKRLSRFEACREINEITKAPVSHSKSPAVCTKTGEINVDYEVVEVADNVSKRALTAHEVAEKAYYISKPVSVIRRKKAETDRIVAALTDALRSRRLCCFSGVMKEIAKRLDRKLEEGDLVNTDNAPISNSFKGILKYYGWVGSAKKGNYYLRREETVDETVRPAETPWDLMSDTEKRIAYKKELSECSEYHEAHYREKEGQFDVKRQEQKDDWVDKRESELDVIYPFLNAVKEKNFINLSGNLIQQEHENDPVIKSGDG
jgi:plasmid rolling circle replication initiator protein Rep